jgi:UDP-glucose 4-epimerase
MGKKNIAVLGAGFIGLNLIRDLSHNNNVFVLDHKDCPTEFVNKIHWYKGEFSDNDLVNEILKNDIDIVYHLISSTVPGDSGDFIIQELYDNVITTVNFINNCISNKIKKVVFVSSSSVYGIQQDFPINELAPTNPISAHGIQKLTLEKYLQLYNYLNDIDVKIVRLSNPYGPGQNINGRQGFVAILMGCLINNTSILIRNNGEIIRDYIYIDDVIKALKDIGIENSKSLVYNLGSGDPKSLNDVVDIVERLTGYIFQKTFAENRITDIPKSVLGINLLKNELGFKTQTNLEEGIKIV